MQALAMVVPASTAKSNWNDEDGIGHERERSGGGTVVGYCGRRRRRRCAATASYSVVAVW